jgi:2-polyprenyl-3-methyl-5-hydroxy-6-metoxy-1,4-benzoquinol methylase
MRGFLSAIDELRRSAGARSILDVGCGEGVLTERWAAENPAVSVVGVDLDDSKLHHEWQRRRLPNLEFAVGDATALPFPNNRFDLVCALEVLEHVADPRSALSELARVSSGRLLLSVPREPAWRALNLARGAYWRAAGNTPGHINHWSRRSFVEFAATETVVEAVATPPPWTIVLARPRG